MNNMNGMNNIKTTNISKNKSGVIQVKIYEKNIKLKK
jgi:hypothetical protein